MTICITTIGEASGNVVKIAGRLQADDFDELLRVVHQCGDLVWLDLSELQSIDRPAVVLLRELIARGVELRSASTYVMLLLAPERQT